jgi:hypothetical protein
VEVESGAEQGKRDAATPISRHAREFRSAFAGANRPRLKLIGCAHLLDDPKLGFLRPDRVHDPRAHCPFTTGVPREDEADEPLEAQVGVADVREVRVDVQLTGNRDPERVGVPLAYPL